MALWKQALAKLRGTADSVRPPVPDSDSEIDLTAEAMDEPLVDADGNSGSEGPAAVDAGALARELRAGIQVSLGDLESCAAGWRYRGHPVMVFGTEAPELTDAQRRRDFSSLVHLFPCCGPLKSDARSVWVATDFTALNEAQSRDLFEVCRTCLEASAGRGASPTGFDFASHVRSNGHSFFAGSACYWKPGSNPRPLQPPVAEAVGNCPGCGCAAEESGWQLHAEDAQQLALPEGICLLCAERQVDGCLSLGEEDMLEAAWARYHYLISQAAQAPAPSWKLAEAILPMSWQPLLRGLQRMLPPPELFYSYGEELPLAVLAWPSLGRGVVAEPAAEGQDGGWSLWSRAQIEAELEIGPR